MTLIPIALIALLPAHQEPVDPAKVVSKMLAYYHGAKSLKGTITMTQTLLGQSTSYVTEVQFELPSKFYLKQTHKQTNKSYFVTSDGSTFSYDFPSNLQKLGSDQRLIESVVQGTKRLTVADIYHAASQSIRDRPAALDIAIGDIEDLRYLRNQWATVTYKGKQKLGEEDVFVITGQWREYPGIDPRSSTYTMGISQDYQLRRYVIRDNLVVPNRGPQEVTTVWDVDLKRDGKPDPNLFKVITATQ